MHPEVVSQLFERSRFRSYGVFFASCCSTCFVLRQVTGLLQALQEIKGVYLEPRGQGKIDGVLAEYYVSFACLSVFFSSSQDCGERELPTCIGTDDTAV